MKVLITGAAGFLGRAFVKHHVDAGDLVLGIDDLSAAGSYWTLEGSHRWTMDLGEVIRADPDRLASVEKFDLAYHFAAPVGGRVKIEGDPMFNADSLRLDSLFFRWAIGKVTQVVYPSSSAVYGWALQEADATALNENMFHPRNTTWVAPDEMYGFTKFVGEFLAWKSEQYDLDTLCIRPFSGYGEGQSLDYPVPSIAKRALDKEDPLVVWGSGYQTRDFIHVDDLVAATVKHPRTNGYESINLGSGQETSFVDIARMCADIVGYNPTITTDASKPEGVLRRYADATRMLRYHTPEVDLRTGLERVMAWLTK